MKEFNNLLSGFKKHLSISGRQKSTISSYATDIKYFSHFLYSNKLDYKKIELINLEHFTTQLKYQQKKSANSIRRKIISIRQFYRFLLEKNKIDSNPFAKSIIPDRKENLPNLLCPKDLKKILKQAKSHPNKIKGTRDCAIIALLALEGLKASEVITLKWDDLILASKQSSLRIKGPKKRAIFLDLYSQNALKAYHEVLTKQKKKILKPKKSKHIFIAFKGQELETALSEITRHGMKFLLYEIGLESGIKKLNTELLRHYAINYLLNKKNDLEAVKQHLGLKQAGNILKHLVKNKHKT